MSVFDDLMAQLDKLPAREREALSRHVMTATASDIWIPNPGPQTEAYYCTADELYFGGSAGGGKSEIGLGLAFTAHERSLLLRRINDDARALADRAVEIVGHSKGLRRDILEWHLPGRMIDFGGCQLETDKQRYKGKPHDLIFFDEAADFLESQVDFITLWLRSTNPTQRCRIVFASNPPTTAEGFWLVRRFAAWLDPKHPNPAKPGEIRWYLRRCEDEDEVDGLGPYPVGAEMVKATSRTFIRSRLEDNPDLIHSGYKDRLHLAPVELRDAYREGKFEASLADQPNQVIPTAWVMAAQKRWRPKIPDGIPMVAMGVDCSGGGKDPLIIAPRYDTWFAPLVEVAGKDMPVESLGKFSAAVILSHRRHGAAIVLDMGGGYGNSIFERLRDNNVQVVQYKGSESTLQRTRDRTLGFYNVRSHAIWKFREALDPDQEGGSPIALPDDQRLLADLVAPKFEPGARGIKVEAKEDVVKRLGRSTDRGDAVMMSWYAWAPALGGLAFGHDGEGRRAGRPVYIMGRHRRRHR